VLVNTSTSGSQRSPVIAALAGGGWVTVWADDELAVGDSEPSSIKFQLFDAAGARVGEEVVANANPAGSQVSPSVVTLDNGGFVIAWTDLSTGNVEFRRFKASGSEVDAADVILARANAQSGVTLMTDGTGFALGLTENIAGNENVGLQRFLANGTPSGGFIDVAATAVDESSLRIVELAGGGFAAAWLDETNDDVMIRGFDAAGVQTFAAQDVSTAADAGERPTITALANGSFVVAWQIAGPKFPDIDGASIRARVVAADGTLVGGEFTVNTLTDGSQSTPDLAALPNGGFVAVYESGDDIRGQLFDAIGRAVGDEFAVNTTANLGQNDPRVTALADGRFVVTWLDNGGGNPDDPFNAIRQQVFDPRDGVVTGTAASETLFGHDLGNDEINGLGGADTLNGLGGTDNLYGGEGGDTYVIDDAGDKAIELTHVGVDLVRASVSFALGANVENLTLTGAAAINATGNALANALTGNDAANVLTGGLGTDNLIGGLGNDTYVLENGSDLVNDSGGSADTIASTITRSLASFAAIENLTLAGSAATNATGNALANTLTGNAAANILIGGLGSDILKGGLGNDTYVLESGADVVTDTGGTADLATSTISRSLAAAGLTTIEKLTLLGSALNGTGNGLTNTITGNTFNNSLDGGLGNDTLNGLGGNDTLVGNAGKDTSIGGTGNDIFRFLNKAHSFGALTDVITDFDDSGNDRIDVSVLFGPTLIYRHNLAFTAAGQLRINDVAGADVIVEVNTGGSLAADFQIRLAGTTLASMTAGDFFL
jgi:Ca2+-binding RTX toxin-like protein